MQNTTRFRELFLHSTDKLCSKLLTENQHSLCYTWGSLPQWRIFSQHYCRGSHIAITNPQVLTLPHILFMLGSNTLYSCQKQVICSRKYAWLFLEMAATITKNKWPKGGTLLPYAWQTRGLRSLNCRWSDRTIRMKAVISPKCSQQGNFLGQSRA